MRIPSQEAFLALDMDMSANERDILSAHYDSGYHSEHAAHLVLTALRNDVPLQEVVKTPDTRLGTLRNVQKLIHCVSPNTDERSIESFFWSLPQTSTDEDRVYLTSAFLSYGESFSSLLRSFRGNNRSNVPDFVPFSWFKKFFEGEQSLREEGIVLETDVSMVLFGYWGIDEVIDFLVRNVDLKEVTKLRSHGIEDLNEIADMTELLPAEWLEEFFG